MLKTIRNHHTIKRHFKDFAERAELVYFGDVNQDDDAHIYKGVTFSPVSTDSNYCHGTVNGYDMTAFTRQSKHIQSGGTSSVSKWTVMAIHLKTSGLPHIVLDAKKHDKTFYDALFVRFPRLRRASGVLQQLNASATQYFDMYMRADATMLSSTLFDDMVMQRLISNYSRYDIEIDNDMLYIFQQHEPTSVRDLTAMLEETLWLAEKIEYRAMLLSPASVS